MNHCTVSFNSWVSFSWDPFPPFLSLLSLPSLLSFLKLLMFSYFVVLSLYFYSRRFYNTSDDNCYPRIYKRQIELIAIQTIIFSCFLMKTYSAKDWKSETHDARKYDMSISACVERTFFLQYFLSFLSFTGYISSYSLFVMHCISVYLSSCHYVYEKFWTEWWIFDTQQ